MNHKGHKEHKGFRGLNITHLIAFVLFVIFVIRSLFVSLVAFVIQPLCAPLRFIALPKRLDLQDIAVGRIGADHQQ